MIDIFASHYHVGVDDCYIDDLISTGANLYMPDDSFKNKINYLYRWGRDDRIKFISYEQYINHPKRFAMIITCNNHWGDFSVLMAERGNIDEPVILTANNNMQVFANYFNGKKVDFLLTHDIDFHRQSKAKYKMIYFHKPRLTYFGEKDIKKSYDNKTITKYQNWFTMEWFNGAKGDQINKALEFRKIWQEKTGNFVRFFGHKSEHGTVMQEFIHENMSKDMFTLSFKREETFGTMINESMLLGTPVILGEEFLSGTHKNYETTDDTCIIKKTEETIEHLIDRILSMSFEEYETLCMQARAIAEIFTSKEPRQKHMKWFFSKIKE